MVVAYDWHESPGWLTCPWMQGPQGCRTLPMTVEGSKAQRMCAVIWAFQWDRLHVHSLPLPRRLTFSSRLCQNCQILPLRRDVLSTSLRTWKTCRPLFGSPGNSCFYICRRSSQKTHTRALHQLVLPAPAVPTSWASCRPGKDPSMVLYPVARPVVSLFVGSSLAHFLRACAELTTLSVG